MKEKKNEVVTVEKVQKKENKGIVITKELVISFVIGLVCGALITSCVCCSCMKHHFPKNQDHQITETQERNQGVARKRVHQQKREQYDKKKSETNGTTNQTESNNTQSEN